MNRVIIGLGLVVAFFATGCKENVEEEIILPVQEVKPNQNHSINAVLWQQTAGEYRALCYQAYNLAKIQLDKKLQEHAFPYEKSPAIVMDLDETVIDNSFFNAQLVLDSATFTKDRWKQWSDLMNAGEVPGAMEFIEYARSKGVNVIFISNRRVAEVSSTKTNLEKLGLTDLDTANFYFRTDGSSKKERREMVSENFDIMMLFGDNLADFTELFDKQSITDRNHVVDSLRAEFGSRFIVLPNTLYGEWESALFDYKYHWLPAQKDSIRLNWIKGI